MPRHNHPKRLGLFGGTFDPIHLGHLKAAESVQEKMALDTILFIPSYHPPHKGKRLMAGPSHRLNMVKLALADRSHFQVSPLEINTRKTSYSILTLEKIRENLPGTTFFFILGIDAFLEIKTWKKYREVLEQCVFVIISRPGYKLNDAKKVLSERYTEYFAEFPNHPPVSKKGREGKGIVLLPIPALDISSTEIRRRIADNEQITDLVPRPVEIYIQKHRLYQGDQ